MDDRVSMDVPESQGSMVQLTAWMLGVSCSGVELRALHIQMVLDEEHFCFCMLVGDGGGLSAPRSYPQC